MNLKRRSKNRQERWSGNRKFLQQSSIPRSLAIWGKDDGITTLVKSILDGSGSVSFGQGGGGSWRREQRATPTYDSRLSILTSHPRPCPSKTFFEPPIVAEIDTVFGCIKSFHKGTSCGRDGLWPQHILDALCGGGSATATDLLKAITSVVNLWSAGRCPPILAEFVASA
ncbi:hypothetical protein Tco_1495083, partial [Tanacetum coccineum]